MTRAGWRLEGAGRQSRGCRLLLAALITIGAAACSTKLPEPDSAAAKLYTQRCATCHRMFAPASLKFEMWKFQVDRMQGEIVRHGLPALTPEERTTLLDYLKRNSG